jgi:hypothetical protein
MFSKSLLNITNLVESWEEEDQERVEVEEYHQTLHFLLVGQIEKVELIGGGAAA